MDERIPVIYILSNGRSGTTLLDLLLGAHPKIWTLGEAQNLPWELVNPRAPCGCGDELREDNFWGEILPHIPTETAGYHVGYFRNEQQVGKVLRWKLLPDLIRGRISREWYRPVEEYGRQNATYFRTVRTAAEKHTGNKVQWLVDASKDPYRLFWLQKSDLFDLRVIHVIKRPEALVYSMSKDWLPQATGKVLRYTGRWIVENAIMQRLIETSFEPGACRVLTYERLASHPEKALSEIGKWIGLSYSEDLVHSFREYENHAISGNMMRWRERADSIQLDERWKQNCPAVYKHLIRILTRPFMDYCGYPA